MIFRLIYDSSFGYIVINFKEEVMYGQALWYNTYTHSNLKTGVHYYGAIIVMSLSIYILQTTQFCIHFKSQNPIFLESTLCVSVWNRFDWSTWYRRTGSLIGQNQLTINSTTEAMLAQGFTLQVYRDWATYTLWL